MSYLVAFNRDRDSYQVPLALAEGGLLEALVTDLYVPDFLAGSAFVRRLGLSHRNCSGLPSHKVSCSARALWLQLWKLRKAKTPEQRSRVFNDLDAGLSEKAGRMSLAAGANLLLYSGYALEAFRMVSIASCRKLLFVYHPQGDFVRDILQEDFARHPEVGHSHQAHLEEIALNEGERVRNEIQLADAIACASTFTAASVQAALGDAGKLVRVVPYGSKLPGNGSNLDAEKPRDLAKPQVLFVGQGTQRKGIHHLIKVWQSGLDQTAGLTLVVNQMDPGVEQMIRQLPVQPRVLSRLSRESLADEYRRADIFVLPSLVEGFGLAYLEALAAGCHVIGTHNTGLPDLEPPEDIATIIPAGDLDALCLALDTTIRKANARELDRERIRAFAATRTWQNFRVGIRNFVEQAE